MALVGYARVSTLDQDTALQRDALARHGVHVVFVESGSGVGLQRELADIWGVSVACLRDAVHRYEHRGRWASGKLQR